MPVNEFGDEIVRLNDFGDVITGTAVADPVSEPLSPELAGERAGKVWDASLEENVPVQIADQWFYDVDISASDPDDFAEPVPDNRTGFSENFIREWTGPKAITKIPIVGGMIGVGQNVEAITAANRLVDSDFDYDSLNRVRGKIRQNVQIGALSFLSRITPDSYSRESDQKRIANAIKEFEFQSRGKTFGGKVASGVSQLPTWMIEFAVTGGLASLGDDVAKKAGEKLLRNYSKTFAGKAAIKTAKLAKGAVIRTSTGLLPRVGEKATARQALIDIGVAGEESWATSLAKAWGDVAIESFSEETGSAITAGLGALIGRLPFASKFIPALQDDWIKITGGTADNFATKMLTKAGYSNIIGEIGEERVGTLLREATGVSDRKGNPFERMWAGMKEDFEPENLGAEIVTILAPASVRRGMTMGVSLTQGVSVPTESEQLTQAVDSGPIQFDEPQDAQGYAAKAKRIAERDGIDVKIEEDLANNTVTITRAEEIAEEPPAEEILPEPVVSAEEGTVAELKKEIKTAVESDPIFEIEQEAQDIATREIGFGVFFVPDDLRGEVQKAIEDNPSLRFNITFDRTKGVPFDEAVQEGFLERAGDATDTILDINDFLDRVAEAKAGRRKIGGISEVLLDKMIASPDPFSQINAIKHQMINTGFTVDEINEAVVDIAEEHEIESEPHLLKEKKRVEKGARVPTEVPKEAEPTEAVPKRIITKDAYEAARARIRDQGKLKAGLDPQDLIDLATVGAFHFETGARKFADWSKKMVADFGDTVKPHLQAIFDDVSKVPVAEPEKKPDKKKVAKKPAKKKKPEFPKNQSVDKAEQVVLGEDPLEQIHEALRQAKTVQPKTEAEKKAELSRRVGAAAGALESNVKRGTPTEQSIFKSSGLLQGPLTEYEQVYESIEAQLTPEAKEAAYSKINKHPGLRYFEILNTATSFRKLLEGTALTPGDVKNIENVFGKTFSDVTDIRQTVSDLYEQNLTLWKAGLLTGIKTSGLNIIANASHAMAETAASVPEALIDNAISLYTGERTRAFTTKGYAAGVIKGIKAGWKYLRTGYSERDIDAKWDYKQTFFGTSKFAKAKQAYTEFIFHLLGAEDQPFYYGSLGKSIASQATAQAINKGLKGKEKQDFIKNLMRHPTDDMVNMASEDAEASVFQNRTNVGDAASAVAKIKPFGFVLPFTRTPSSIAVQIVSDFTPIGLVKEVVDQAKKGELDQRRLSKAFGRSTVGTAALFTGGVLVSAGLMTLDHPKDERERKLWELEGRKANSIKLNGKWRSIQVLGPLGSTLIIGGHFQRELEETGSPTKAMTQALAGGAKSFSEQTFVRGLNQALSAVTDPERSAERWFTSMAGSVVPTIVSDIARAGDDKERRTEGAAQRIRSRIPILRDGLPPRIDVFGQDLPRYSGNVLESMIDPSRPSKIRNDVVVDELRRLADNDIKVTPTLLGDRDGFDVLTVEENTQLWRRSGELTYKVLLAWIDSDGYRNIPNNKAGDFVKGETIESITRKTKDAAKAEMVQIKISQGVSVIKLAEGGLISIQSLDALQYFTK